ncbi:MAG: hypothetical protein CVV42_12845 [Candidatus Riflebacteria bacterium HGW-Riflebacteria-2]|jgi:hypothetical protein|nr:MAG: hypothetical protein CVV42_12845 [Candidatus Riflebacteria bacterium HGW-Riflebacteria-2]
MPARNLEIILKKASVDADFREKLLKDRSRSLAGHELELDADEKAMLDTMPEAQLRQMISVTPVSAGERSLLAKAALTATVVAAATAIAIGVAFHQDQMVIVTGILPDFDDSSYTRPKPVKPALAGPEADAKMAKRVDKSPLAVALLAFRKDVGSFPIPGGPPYSPEALAKANEKYFGNTAETNILVNREIDASDLFPAAGSREEALEMFRRLWKGPYMAASPQDFMKAGEGSKIMLELREQTLCLRRSADEDVETLVRFDGEASVDEQVSEVIPH